MPQPEPTKELQSQLLEQNGPVCLIIRAQLRPVADLDRFQPAGFPEIGHVIYNAPRRDGAIEKVCIVDSPASMANHLETVCLADGAGLHPELNGLPCVRCVTDASSSLENRDSASDGRMPVVTSLTEGHRIASDLDGTLNGQNFREKLREEFKIIEVRKDKTYFIPPETWWSIYKTIFKYDPNSLVHGVLFAKEQIKISRFLTAHLEAFGASRVGRSGVKFDRLGKTTSGQPIFAVDEETAREIRATFILDLALLRSYGRDKNGLADPQKRLLLDLALWKIQRLLARPFRYRSGCYLQACPPKLSAEPETEALKKTLEALNELPAISMQTSIKACEFGDAPVTDVYYPEDKLFKPAIDQEKPTNAGKGQEAEEAEEADEAEEG